MKGNIKAAEVDLQPKRIADLIAGVLIAITTATTATATTPAKADETPKPPASETQKLEGGAQ